VNEFKKEIKADKKEWKANANEFKKEIKADTRSERQM
jgi:hypothetical protein